MQMLNEYPVGAEASGPLGGNEAVSAVSWN